MPRPRFHNLPPGKRDHILLTAGRAFAELGYEKATISHLLAQAGISTGAAYYYFDNKVDLFTAALTFHVDRLVISYPRQFTAANADDFWAEFGSMVGKSMELANDTHRTVAALRRAWKTSPELSENPEIARQLARNEALLQGFFRRGRELGAIRTDLPDTLLLRCGLAVDEAFDDWLADAARANARPPEQDELLALMRPLVSMLRAMFSPPQTARGPASE